MKPPFRMTDEIVTLVAEIAERIGSLTATLGTERNLRLRRNERIRTIHGSLAIEQNVLTLEQVTAVLDGRPVIAPPKDIEEVRNAYEIYEYLDRLNPTDTEDLLKAHGVMMRGLIPDAGEFRTRPVGVVNERREIVHFGTLPDYVPSAVGELMAWLKDTRVHPLVKGCVFHYEFELIHPFSDGNGRVGRLWHTLILSRWNPVFAWLPVESMIYRNQESYYRVINDCNDAADSTEFIAFMLNVILQTVREAVGTSAEQVSEQVSGQVRDKCGTSAGQVGADALLAFCAMPRSREEMQEYCRIPSRKVFYRQFLQPLLQAGRLRMTLPDKPNSSRQKYVTVEKIDSINGKNHR